MEDATLYWMLIGSAVVLIGAEFFIPGGILGIIGVIAMISAIFLGFSVFDLQGGMISAIGIVFGGMVLMFFWIKYCPQSFIGKWFTLQESGKDFKSYDDVQQELVGKQGEAKTALRPAGIAVFDGKKYDVVSEAGFIEQGSTVKVLEVAGSRIAVRKVEQA